MNKIVETVKEKKGLIKKALFFIGGAVALGLVAAAFKKNTVASIDQSGLPQQENTETVDSFDIES